MNSLVSSLLGFRIRGALDYEWQERIQIWVKMPFSLDNQNHYEIMVLVIRAC